jgi:CubicO group peptidase (beta-lactamase class C family)
MAAWTLLAAFGALAATCAADDKTAPVPSPEEARVREVLNLPLGFPAYVFTGAAFPEARFEQAARAQELLGPHTVRTTFYDRGYHRVEEARKPGPYAAIIEGAPERGRPMRRYATLYRVPETISADSRPSESASEFAQLTGLDPEAVSAQQSLVTETVKGRPWSELARDPRFARLLAGLHEGRPTPAPVRKNEDAFAQERQWWVGLKRRLTGMDRLYPHRFLAPRMAKGSPAPMVHEGSLAEAGMKPDAPEKIDAALQAWAADTDQAFAVCVVRHGVIVLHKAYGIRDGKPMTVETKSWMASVTKTMSASLMMMLVDRGLVSLDDRVDRFIPALRDMDVPTPLTIRHLYTHTSGLFQWPGWNDEMPDVEERIADYYPLLKVGKEWGYTGTGNMLGSKIAEEITGEAVPLLFKHHLLDPLGMTHTDVIGTHADAFSVPLDMARFGQMLLNRGAYGEKQFFRPETFQQMLPQKLTKLLGPDAVKTFGISLDGTPERFGHGAASAATFSVNVPDDLVVIMTRNSIGTNYDRYNGKFWGAIQDGIERPAQK